ncbi:MAG: ABC transporter permease [Bdellovibrionota bacterium]
MRNYLLKRLLVLIPTLVGITVVTFFIMQLAPGSPVERRLAALYAGERQGAISQEVIEQTKKLYGLDKPLPVQYWNWLKRIARFDFGESFKDHRPVSEKISEVLPITLTLNAISIVCVYLLSLPWGIYSAKIAGSKLDRGVTFFLFVLYSLPSFWVATMLILLLGGGEFLDVFPTYGIQSYGAETWALPARLWDWTRHLFLPVACLSYGGLAVLARYARVSMQEVINQDYIRTARAKGLPEVKITYKHAFRNALLPLITLLAGLLPELFGGSVIIETIFSIPGMGKLGFEAIRSLDYPLIMAITTISALLTLMGILIADVLYVVADPRISFEGKAGEG